MRPALFLLFLLPLTSVAQDAEDWLSLTPLHEELAPGLTLHLIPALADTSAYVVEYDDDGERLAIDGCPFWYGTDNDFPTTYLEEGYVDWEGQRLDLDVSCITTCEFCTYEGFTATPLESTEGWAVSGTLSDGAGTASVTWLVAPTGTVRTRVSSWHDDEMAGRRAQEERAALTERLVGIYSEIDAVQKLIRQGTATDAEADRLGLVLEELDALDAAIGVCQH